MTALLERLSRATVWLDRGITRSVPRGFSEFEAWRDQVLEKEEPSTTSSAARSSPKTLDALRRDRAAQAQTCAASANCGLRRTSASTVACSRRDG